MNPAVGELLKPLRIESVSAAGMKTWAMFLRDPNPIHLDPQAVLAKGLGERVINQGPANVGYVITMLLAAFPGAQLESLDARFLDNVFAGDAVEASGRITAVDADGAQHLRIGCDVWLKADGRAEVIGGRATLKIPVTQRSR